MSRRLALPFAAMIAMALSACGVSVHRPDIKLNPQPSQRYEITMTVEGAPGPFESVDGSVYYHVDNAACVPLAPFSGATIEPQADQAILFRRVGDSVYKADFYADRFVDEDYFHQGVCHWSVVSVSGVLVHGQNRFIPGIVGSRIASGERTTLWFSNSSYRGESAIRDDGGLLSRTHYKNAEDTFSIRLQAVRVPATEQTSDTAGGNTRTL